MLVGTRRSTAPLTIFLQNGQWVTSAGRFNVTITKAAALDQACRRTRPYLPQWRRRCGTRSSGRSSGKKIFAPSISTTSRAPGIRSRRW
jgi:hypothetical protein